MKKHLKYVMIMLLGIMLSKATFAQQLVLSGKITYERKENMHKQFDDDGEDNSWAEQMRNNTPKYRIDQFQLVFNTKKSLYNIIVEDENPAFQWWKYACNNTVGSNRESNKMYAYKTVYENNYNITDSLPVFKWKIHDEYREIANHNCRKASTIIFDSLYIIAFFTDEIPVSWGPESFQGLPGMILGLVVPRLNITSFATKVESYSVLEQELTMPPPIKKAKIVTRKSFMDDLINSTKDWGEYASKVYWKCIL